MRRILLVTAILMANVLTMSAAKKSVINRIEPTDWYVGMKNPQVQLMVYGQGIRDVQDVTTDYPGVTIDSRRMSPPTTPVSPSTASCASTPPTTCSST